jgi:hypothetical protein
LEAVVLDERCLERVKSKILLESFNYCDFLSLQHRGQGHAGQNTAAVDEHSACAALAAITRFFGADQPQLFAQCIKKRCARLHNDQMSLTIDGQIHWYDFMRSAVGGRSVTPVLAEVTVRSVAHVLLDRTTSVH